MDASLEQKVRQRAYEIWMAAGRDGLAELHWLSAEQAIMGEITIPNAKILKTAKARTAKPAPSEAAAPAAVKKPAVRKKPKNA